MNLCDTTPSSWNSTDICWYNEVEEAQMNYRGSKMKNKMFTSISVVDWSLHREFDTMGHGLECCSVTHFIKQYRYRLKQRGCERPCWATGAKKKWKSKLFISVLMVKWLLHKECDTMGHSLAYSFPGHTIRSLNPHPTSLYQHNIVFLVKGKFPGNLELHDGLCPRGHICCGVTSWQMRC